MSSDSEVDEGAASQAMDVTRHSAISQESNVREYDGLPQPIGPADPAHADYADGAIVRLVCQDFMTYDHQVIEPGARLNVLIGPNGTGKSTIICAICLVFAGELESLGRSDRLVSFIKQGSKRAIVEATIKVAEGKYVIRMVIDQVYYDSARDYMRPDGHKFWINCQTSSKTQVQRLASKFNIQINNPCSFLAQDKVKSFSEQSPRELLANTMLAGSKKLLALHKKLRTKYGERAKIDERIKECELQIGALAVEIDNLKPRVANYESRSALQQEVILLEKRVAILNYQEAEKNHEISSKEHYKQQAFERKTRQEKLRADQKRNQATRDTYTARNEHREMGKRLRDLAKSIKNDTDQRKFDRELKRLQQAVATEKENLVKWMKKDEELTEELRRCREEAAQAQFDEAAFLNDQKKEKDMAKMHEDEMNMIEKKITDNSTLRNVRRQDLIRLEDNLSRVRDEEQSDAEKRLQKLRHLNPDAFELWRWYQTHVGEFSHPVYVPIIHVNLRNNTGLSAFENVFARRDFAIFICGSTTDEKRLLAVNPQWRISTGIIDPAQAAMCPPTPQMSGDLRNSFGFVNYLGELYDAPTPVRYFIESQYRMNQVAIGTAKTEQSYEKVADTVRTHNIRVFFTDTDRVEILTSYSGEHFVNKGPVRRPFFFEFNVEDTMNLVAPKKKAIEAEFARIRAELASLEDDQKRLMEERQDSVNRRKYTEQHFADRHSRGQKLHTMLKIKETGYEHHKTCRPNVAQAEADLETCEREQCNMERRLCENVKSLMKSLVEASADLTINVAKMTLAENSETETTDQSEKCAQKLEDSAPARNAAMDEFDRTNNLLRRATERLTSKTGLATLDETKLSDAAKKELEAMNAMFKKKKIPNDVEKCEQLIGAERAKARVVTKDGDESDVKKLAEFQGKLDKVQAMLNRDTTKRDDWIAEMQASLDEWLGNINKLVDALSVSFGGLFSQLGCRGTVELGVPTEAFDVNHYGINICVSFRNNEPLKRLDHQVQSGGERSVATILFLLALQELSPVPFRCVDEINQGMDPTNERNVFDLIVQKLESSAAKCATQYFLLTPKLLPDLKYGTQSRIITIFNSPTCDSQNSGKWRTESIIHAILRSRT